MSSMTQITRLGYSTFCIAPLPTILLAIVMGILSGHATAQQGAEPRECRLIVNYDQMSLWGLQLGRAHRTKPIEAKSVKAMLESVVDEHAKAQVDRLVHCVFAMCLGTVPPNMQSFARESWSGQSMNDDTGEVVMEKAGYDLIQVLLDRSHHDGIEFMAGLRMNDRHGDPWTLPFAQKHPEWRLREIHAMDYKFDGVRQAVLDVAKELLERYDFDGIELDWMRHCHVFNPDEAEANAHLLNDFMTQMRRLIDDASAKRGRRLWLGVRIPATTEECKALGFDVKTWVHDKSILLDYLCPSDFFYNNLNTRTEDFVAFTEGTSCKVYPSVHPKIAEKHFHDVPSPAAYRAMAKNFYAYGADGISAYNYQYHWRADMGSEDDWPSALRTLTELRESGVVSRGNRQYMFYPMWPRGKNPSGTQFDRYNSIELIRGSNASRGSLSFRVAEDPLDKHTSSTFEFKVMGMRASDRLRVQLNGVPVPETKMTATLVADGRPESKGRPLPAYHLYRVELSAAAMPPLTRWGDNEVTLELAASEAAATQEPLSAQEFTLTVEPVASP